MNIIINPLLVILLTLVTAPPRKYKAIGMASYYSTAFDGKKTASGELFNSNEYTGAHRTLPFNTIVNVINLSNGRSVKVKINDRGPYSKSRIIDISYSAAKQIGLIEKGTIKVKIEPSTEDSLESRIVKEDSKDNVDIFKKEKGKIYDFRGKNVLLNNYTCRIFKTNSEMKARNFIEKIEGYKTIKCYLRILDGKILKKYEIITGSFLKEEEAIRYKDQLQKQGFSSSVIYLNKNYEN